LITTKFMYFHSFFQNWKFLISVTLVISLEPQTSRVSQPLKS
jgi:hypothetical protein